MQCFITPHHRSHHQSSVSQFINFELEEHATPEYLTDILGNKHCQASLQLLYTPNIIHAALMDNRHALGCNRCAPFSTRQLQRYC